MPQISKAEKDILAEIGEDQEQKSRLRAFRENLQRRAERKRARQEEKEARRKQRETQRFANEARLQAQPTDVSLDPDSVSDGKSEIGRTSPSPMSPAESIGLKSEATSFMSSKMLRSSTTVSGLSMLSDGSEELDDSDEEDKSKALSRQTTRMSSVKHRAQTSAMSLDEDSQKKHKGTISGAIGGGIRATGKTMLKTGTTVGLLLGVVPSKTSRDYLLRKVTRWFPSRRGVGQVRPQDDADSDSDSVGTEDSEAEAIREETKRRFGEKASKSWTSMDNAGENIKARAREVVGYPADDSEDDWTFVLRLQRATGILWFRMQLAVRKIAVADNPPHPSLKRMVESLRFEAFIGALIVVNGIISGMDAMYKPGEVRPSLITVAENVFVVIFVTEYFLRLRADTWVWMFEPMNMFDTFVVWITGVLVVWILEPLGIEIDILRRLAALRVLRLGRLARAVRIMPMFHELWMLVSGVLECTRLLFWSFVIIGVVHFMSAVVVMETITKSELFEDDPTVQNFFGTLSYSMFTLFQFMTFDSWASIARPIIYQMPEAAAFFLLFMGIAGIVLFNLMTAIVVKNAFDAAEADEEAKAQQQVQQQAKMAADLRTMFIALDEDGSGTLTREEFTDVLDDVLFIRQMKVLDIDLEELPDIFDILDDGDGNITTEEFCLGLTRLQGVAMSRDMLRCTSRNIQLNTLFGEVRNTMGRKVDKTLGLIETSMEEAHVNLVEMQQMTAEVLKKLEEAGLHRAVRSTTEALDEVPPPTLEDIAKREEEAARQAELARFGRANSSRSVKSTQAKETLPRIPSAWVLNRKKDLEERKQALRAQQHEDVGADVQETLVPGVLKEFQREWALRELHVPQKRREDRLAEAMAAKKEPQEAKEKKLPAQLPASLAPNTVYEQEAEQAVVAEEEAEEVVRKDVNKMNIKELKELADSLGMEGFEGMKKVQLLPLVLAKLEEVANLGKAPLSMM
ncbi:unnamed protein product [Effrenium voratum]|nr:unnamed protein product [Effrenium voratum]